MKRLPLGIQTFSEIINGNMLYVDKTRFIPAMTERYKYVFLSRPRRFGKSLFVSMLGEYFNGNKSLFQGLDVQTIRSWESSPVIRIDFSTVPNKNPDIFNQQLLITLREIGDSENIDINTDFPQRGIDLLIKGLYDKYQKKVVILVDEYDKPIVDHLDLIDNAEGNKTILRDFFTSVKGLDQYIRFMFITGVSKFSKVSLFSGMNQIVDISLHSDFSQIMGYTAEEIEKCFGDYIDSVTAEKNLTKQGLISSLATWYNGYSWDGSSKVFNPFSVLSYFDKKTFGNYWFTTGTPSHLIKLLRQNNFDLNSIEDAKAVESSFNSDDLSRISLISILFQTGYLTIKRLQEYFGVNTYILDYPNYEVKDAVYRLVTSELLAENPEFLNVQSLRMRDALRNGDTEAFLRMLKSLFAQIPSNLFMAEEKYYHSLFIMLMFLTGIKTDAEVNTNLGRIDGVMETKEKIYIVEFKYEKTPGIALEQIHAKKYYEKYSGKGKQIILLGVNFSRENISMVTESV